METQNFKAIWGGRHYDMTRVILCPFQQAPPLLLQGHGSSLSGAWPHPLRQRSVASALPQSWTQGAAYAGCWMQF